MVFAILILRHSPAQHERSEPVRSAAAGTRDLMTATSRAGATPSAGPGCGGPPGSSPSPSPAWPVAWSPAGSTTRSPPLLGGARHRAVIGAGQWLASRGRLRPVPWIAATAVGMGAGLLLGATVVGYGPPWPTSPSWARSPVWCSASPRRWR